MRDPAKVGDDVMLVEDVPQHNLLLGQLGRILEILAPDTFQVGFAVKTSSVITKLTLKLSQFTVLRHETTLDEDRFWKLIEEAKAESGGDGERQVQLLVDRLAEMSIADIFVFGEMIDHFEDLAYFRELWTAANIISFGGTGNDGFTDFRAWLIAQGKQIFFDVLHDPDILADIVSVHDDEYGVWGDVRLERMNYVSFYAYEKKTGEDMPIVPVRRPDRAELRGEWWDEETTCRNYPKLTKKFQET